MHIRKSRLTRFTLLLVCFLTLASVSEARIGGGRSSGSRGARSFGTRTYQSPPAAPSRSNLGNEQLPPGAGNLPPPQTSPGMGSFGRGMMGGLAGGFLGSMLFGGMSQGMGGGMGGGGGFGLIEMLLLLGAGYWLYRTVMNRRGLGGNLNGQNAYSGMSSGQSSLPAPSGGEEAQAALLGRGGSFDLSAFKDERTDDFMKIQAAWNYRDLSRLENLVSPELKRQLSSDIAELKSKGQINRIENIAVRGCTLIEAWDETGQTFATLRFRANLSDYTVEESSGAVVAGDKLQPVKFEEDWTFVKPAGAAGSAWILSAIEA